MITRVLDEGGRVLHDCAHAGCDVSWDGVALVAIPEPVAGDPSVPAVAAGDQVPGAPAPDLTGWDVSAPDADGRQTARRLPAA